MICRYLVTSTAFSDCIAFALPGRRGFSVRRYCGREQRQEPLRFPAMTAPVSLHIFRASKMGISVAVIASTLALCSLVSAVCTCTKNGSPDREAQRSFTKREKELNSLIIRNYESKENDNRGGTPCRHQPLPELPQDRKCPRHEEALLWS